MKKCNGIEDGAFKIFKNGPQHTMESEGQEVNLDKCFITLLKTNLKKTDIAPSIYKIEIQV